MKKTYPLLILILLLPRLSYAQFGNCPFGNTCGSGNVTSVTSYGAVCNGTTDDSVAINAALVAGAGGTVMLPQNKTCMIADTIYIPANTVLEGYGEGSVIKLIADANDSLDTIATDLSVPTSYNPMIVPSQTGGAHPGIVIRNLKVDGNDANQSNIASASGDSYAGISTQNSTGMIIEGVKVVDVMGTLNITSTRRAFCLFVYGSSLNPVTFTNASWTDATKTLTIVSGTDFTGVTANKRINFTAGTGVETGKDFFVNSVAGVPTSITLFQDINTSSGDVASGVAGRIYDVDPTSAGASSYLKVSNSYFDDGGYDCVGIRGVGATHTTIENSTLLRGGKTSIQVYEGASDIDLIGNKYDNTGSLGISSGGVWVHSGKRVRVKGGSIYSDVSAPIAIFGDNSSGGISVPPRRAENVIFDGVYAEYSGNTSGQPLIAFDGAGAGYQYARNSEIINSTLVLNVGTSTNYAALFGTTGTAQDGVIFSNNRVVSNSNNPILYIGNAVNVLMNGNSVYNSFSGSGSAARALVIQPTSVTTPQNIVINGNIFSSLDIDSDMVRSLGGIGVTFTNNTIQTLNSSTPSLIPLTITDGYDSIFSGNQILVGTSGTAAINITGTSSDNLVITNNRVGVGPNQTTAPVRCIAVPASTNTNILIANNDFSRCSTSAWGSTFVLGTGSKVFQNMQSAGSTTEASGTATITAAATTVTVTHGVQAWRTLRASDITVVPTNTTTAPIGKISIQNVGATTFDIVIEAVPGVSTATFAWTMKANEF